MNQTTIWEWNLKAYNLGGYAKRFVYFFTKREIFKAPKNNKYLVKSANQQKKAYLCALGPSLKKVDINKIQGDTIVVNRFYKVGKENPGFVPTYYLIIDGDFTNSKYVNDFKEAIDFYAPKGTIFIFNSKMYNHPFLKTIPSNQLYFVSCIDGRVKPKKDYRIDGLHPAFMNVASEAILLLMLMGYKEVTMLGCDFNSFASTTQVHCYKDASQTRLWSMSEELYAYSIAAKDHSDLAELAKRLGCKVANSTRGSLIDAYPMEIEESLYIE